MGNALDNMPSFLKLAIVGLLLIVFSRLNSAGHIGIGGMHLPLSQKNSKLADSITFYLGLFFILASIISYFGF